MSALFIVWTISTALITIRVVTTGDEPAPRSWTELDWKRFARAMRRSGYILRD
jgi:hypothetical protein